MFWACNGRICYTLYVFYEYHVCSVCSVVHTISKHATLERSMQTSIYYPIDCYVNTILYTQEERLGIEGVYGWIEWRKSCGISRNATASNDNEHEMRQCVMLRRPWFADSCAWTARKIPIPNGSPNYRSIVLTI